MSEFNLKAVLRQTGLSPETLRAWERRYGAVSPKRTETGRRLYSASEVHRLGLLALLVNRGFRISDIANLNNLELTRRVEKSKNTATVTHQMISSSRGMSELIEALEHFDLTELRKRLTITRFELSPREFSLELVPAVMFRVGALIEENRFSVAEEHAISHLIQNEILAIYESLKPLEVTLKPKKMLFATREGDHHEIGLTLAALLCRSRGTQCQYLGPNLPTESLVKAVKTLRPSSVVLAVSHLPQEEEKVSTQDFVSELDRQLPSSVEIWLGGSASFGLRKRIKTNRPLWIFESLHDLETKLDGLFGAR